jgi:hypothetical protein
MKTKKYFQKYFLSLFLIIGFSIAPSFVLAAVDWSVTIGNGTGSGAFALANPYGLPEGSIYDIISNILFWLLSIFAVLGIVGFVISGIFYLISAGDEGMADKGKDGMKWSVIGVIVGLSGYIVMKAVASMLGGQSASF